MKPKPASDSTTALQLACARRKAERMASAEARLQAVLRWVRMAGLWKRLIKAMPEVDGW